MRSGKNSPVYGMWSTYHTGTGTKRRKLRDLSDFFEMTEQDVKAKINALRTYCSKELVKLKASKKSGAGTDETFISKWPHFNSLNFLRDTIKPRKTTSSLVCKQMLETNMFI